MLNWTKTRLKSSLSKLETGQNIEIQSNSIIIPEATNEFKRDLKKDFENFTNFMHQQMMRITIINLDVARDIDIEQLRMEQFKAMRLKRIG
jgi:hypothetical protein